MIDVDYNLCLMKREKKFTLHRSRLLRIKGAHQVYGVEWYEADEM